MSAADQEGRNVAILVASLPDDEQLDELVTASTPGPPQHRRAHRGGPRARCRRSRPTTPRCSAPWPVRRSRSWTGRGAGRCCRWSGRTAPRWSGPRSPRGAARGVVPAWAGILGLGLVLLLGALAISTRLGRRVSDPVRAVAQTAHRLREGDLTARAPMSGTEETVELAEALNGLAERTTELLARSGPRRGPVAPAAHAGHRPAPGLRGGHRPRGLPAAGGARPTSSAPSTRSWPRRGARSAATCRRAATRSRCFASGRRSGGPRRGAGPPPHRGAPRLRRQRRPGADDLADLVDVLIDNVFAHTPDGTALRVGAAHAGDRLRVEVADAGPGFAARPGRRRRTPRRHHRSRPGHRASDGARLRRHLPDRHGSRGRRAVVMELPIRS